MAEVSRRQLLQGAIALGVPPLVVAHAVPSTAQDLDPSKIRICTQLPSPSKGAALDACLWRQRAIKVGFLDGAPTVREKVRHHAQEWTLHCPLRFEFGSPSGADIRITFDSNRGSWSYIGRCQSAQPGDATMNYGWVTSTSNDEHDRQVILHEFGHALGLLHEHQQPGAAIPWDREAVYEYYRRTQNPPWDRARVDENVFSKYSEGQTSHTDYDDASIMRYAIPKELTRDRLERPWNSQLSVTDKKFIGDLYKQL